MSMQILNNYTGLHRFLVQKIIRNTQKYQANFRKTVCDVSREEHETASVIKGHLNSGFPKMGLTIYAQKAAILAYEQAPGKDKKKMVKKVLLRLLLAFLDCTRLSIASSTNCFVFLP